MEASSLSTTDLSESIFFTARKGRTRSNKQDAASSSESASSSCEYYSARIQRMMERTSELNMSQEDAEIEASKEHWTVVEPDYFTAATTIGTELSSSVSVSCLETLTEIERMAMYEKNVQEMRRLQEAHPESQFFRIGDDGLVLGKKIAEGGQAEIYDAGVSSLKYIGRNPEEDGKALSVVWKVFKAGYLVSDLQKQWPLALLHKYGASNIPDVDVFMWNPMFCGRLLEDGRFAFEMVRMWGDLRKFLDVRMQHNDNQHPPFMMPDGNYHECCMLWIIGHIAMGMSGLHGEGILHRDLKAANVLIYKDSSEGMCDPDPIELRHNIVCLVTDYECSIGVVGTGYWRAPEILQALKHRSVNATPNLFTQKTDVYSFAMTSYEVLTGLVPFEKVGNCNGEALVDEVIGGKRPTLPSHLQPWMVKLMNKCWHMDPLERPTFDEIVDLLQGMLDNDSRCKEESIFFQDHDYRS